MHFAKSIFWYLIDNISLRAAVMYMSQRTALDNPLFFVNQI